MFSSNHIVENNGSEWLNLHNMDDFIVFTKILLCAKRWAKERLSAMSDVVVPTVSIPCHFTQPEEWNVKDTISWLKSNGLDAMESSFKTNQVDGKMLLCDLDLDCLVEMGCSKVHSKKLLRLVNDDLRTNSNVN